MRWRPHIYITGDRGAGKSTVLDTLIKRLLGSFAIYADGGSTEAGIRLSIVNSSRTVIMDEAEGNTKADRDKIAAVMNLIRASSSGGHIRNANDEYRCRASFLMAGINPQINNEADKSRIVVIHLRADERPNAAERFVDWQRRVDHVTRSGASGRLIARLIECSHHLPETLRSISAAIRNMGSSARFADQHAALLSGVWLLVKSRAPEGEEAAEFLKKVGLTLEQNTEIEEASGEPWKVLSEIMTSDHRYDVNGMARSATVASIIQMVKHDPDTSAAAAAAAGLSDLGIEVDHDMVRIASTSPRLKRMLINTPWSADGWARHLIALPGAREGKRRAFRGMHRRRTVEVPIDLVLGINEPEEVELPLEDWA
jgi:putative DNA primase/helicase